MAPHSGRLSRAVSTERVEKPSFFWVADKEGQGVDKLGPNGSEERR